MAESIIPMGQVKYLTTSVTCTITTLDNNVYIYETSYPFRLPQGSQLLYARIRAATVYLTWNENTRKMYICCAKEKPVEGTYDIDVFYI